MKIKWKPLLIALGIPLAVGGLAVLLSGGMSTYETLNQPPLSPPGWVFPIVWSILSIAIICFTAASTCFVTLPRSQFFCLLTLLANSLFTIKSVILSTDMGAGKKAKKSLISSALFI